MNEFLKDVLEDTKGISYINDIPINEFQSVEELTLFVKEAKKKNFGVVLHYETSNYHQGVVVQLFDKETCTVKDYIFR